MRTGYISTSRALTSAPIYPIPFYTIMVLSLTMLTVSQFTEPRPYTICSEFNLYFSPSFSLSIGTTPAKGWKYSTGHLSSCPVLKFFNNAKGYLSLSFQDTNSKGPSALGNNFQIIFCFLTNYYPGKKSSWLVTKGYICWS